VFADLLCQRLAGTVTLSGEQVAALEAHCNLLLRWNQRLNLTSIESLEEIAERHYGESLFLGLHLPPGPLRIADIGSGAGFPGFPVAVLRPDCAVTLVESNKRKAVFLREASRGMTNVRVLAKRVEAIGEQFDCAISRAVSYQDLMRPLQKIAEHVDLLTGAEEPPEAMGFIWQPGVPLPWGRQRFLRIGHRVLTSCFT
jgi:16S rRNA (guanine527-N7)-methyltransferase